MIIIDKACNIGEGEYQRCYIHLEDRNLCLKISKPREEEDPRISGELKYYKKIQKNLTILFLPGIMV
jgi:hypothetical protein